MELPFFSIVIPTLNSEITLQNCLNSILSQTFSDYEIIVIDGLSTDSTLSLVKGYSSQYNSIRCHSEEDKGIYDAMNKGIRRARGEWLYFLGSDDLINNKEVLQQVYSLDKRDYEVVYGNAKIIGKTAWAEEGQLYDGEFNLQKLLKKNICQQAMFYHRSCFTDTPAPFNVEYEICADWDFNFRCWARKEFLFVDITVVDFYGGGESTRKNANQKFYDDFNKNVLRYFGPNVVKSISETIPAQQELREGRKKLLLAKNWLKSKLKPNAPQLSK
ncbi:MAG: glycosyltransferase family 2 protein [Ginsengibacter sp.]